MTQPPPDELIRRLADARITGVRPLAGGASSLTYAGEQAGAPVVIKVAPTGVAPTGHRDVLRQARIVRLLGPTRVPVPEVLAEDAGSPPAVPPLFVMSRIDGTSLEPLFDNHAGNEPHLVVAERFRQAASTLGRLHRIGVPDLGLNGEPVIGAAAEITRWECTLQTVDPQLVPGWQQVSAALRSSQPPEMAPSILHGDFRLGNMLARHDRIVAVIDWEIWSVGDPRVDLGWFLINADPRTYRRATPFQNKTPPPNELADVYRDAYGGRIPDLDWFQALACFKSSATWALIVKHNRRHRTPDPALESMAPVLPHLLDRALAFLNG